jgi:hypothetical protein
VTSAEKWLRLPTDNGGVRASQRHVTADVAHQVRRAPVGIGSGHKRIALERDDVEVEVIHRDLLLGPRTPVWKDHGAIGRAPPAGGRGVQQVALPKSAGRDRSGKGVGEDRGWRRR